MSQNIRTIAIIGTGLIGSGMATLFLANGYDVRMLATGDAGCRKGLAAKATVPCPWQCSFMPARSML